MPNYVLFKALAQIPFSCLYVSVLVIEAISEPDDPTHATQPRKLVGSARATTRLCLHKHLSRCLLSCGGGGGKSLHKCTGPADVLQLNQNLLKDCNPVISSVASAHGTRGEREREREERERERERERGKENLERE